MKKMILAMALSAILLLAAGVAGKWSGRIVVDGADDMDVVLTLKDTGGSTSGTIAAASQGAPIELQSVKLDGDRLTFDVPYRGQIFKFNLTANGNDMKGSLKGATEDGSPVTGTITLKKSE